MPDMRLNTALNVTNDLKTRPVADQNSGELSNSQFMDMMMSRLSALSNEDSELKTLLTKVSQKNGTDQADNEALLSHLKKMQDKPAVEKADPVERKADVKDKIKARVKEIAAQDKTPVKDTKAMKALQKVAKFLVKANEEGEVSLPPAMVEKLQDFLAKGDDLKAFDMASFMSEFSDMFKTFTIAMPASGQSSANLQWPEDIQQAFNDLGLENLSPATGEVLDMMSVMRAVKTLVNQSEKSAVQSLNDKANANVAAQEAPAAALPVDKPAAVQEPAVQAAKMAQEAPVSVIGLMTKQTAQEHETAQKDAAPVSAEKKSDDGVKDLKASELPSRHISAEAVKAAAQSTNTALAADVKNAFTAATPVMNADTSAVVVAKSESIASSSLTAKASVANTEILRDMSSAKPSAATQQIMAQIQTRGNKSTQISVQLTPAELGRVEVRLSIAKDGQTHAVVVADKPETLALLQKDAAHLERSLQQAGINAQAGNMSFNLRDQNQAQQFGQGRKRFSREAIGDVKTQDMSISALNDAAIFSDTRINYHA